MVFAKPKRSPFGVHPWTSAIWYDVQFRLQQSIWYWTCNVTSQTQLMSIVRLGRAAAYLCLTFQMTLKPRLHQRNMLLEATFCAQQATCCRQQATCCGYQATCCRTTCCAGVNEALLDDGVSPVYSFTKKTNYETIILQPSAYSKFRRNLHNLSQLSNCQSVKRSKWWCDTIRCRLDEITPITRSEMEVGHFVLL